MKRLFGIIILLAVFLTSCAHTVDTSGESYSDHSGVYLEILSVEKDGKDSILNVRWHNNTSSELTYYAYYDMEYKRGSEWVDITAADVSFIEIAYSVAPNSHSDKTYTTAWFDTSRVGTYRLKSYYHLHRGDEVLHGDVWIEFKIS